MGLPGNFQDYSFDEYFKKDKKKIVKIFEKYILPKQNDITFLAFSILLCDIINEKKDITSLKERYMAHISIRKDKNKFIVTHFHKGHKLLIENDDSFNSVEEFLNAKLFDDLTVKEIVYNLNSYVWVIMKTIDLNLSYVHNKLQIHKYN